MEPSVATSPLTEWQALAVAADQGHLYLHPEAAATCSAACDSFVAKLSDLKARVALLADIDGWGEFTAGQQLRDFYAGKAVGGDNNMVDVLQSHIDVVIEMQTVFKKFFVDVIDSDDVNSDDIRSQGPG